ncbi:polysaccharide biosynthesis/export family protein [Algirhabdus cladophorae]|uniref:polysaccharide biosynthesis/export family protein n=1 Tax=Algirhabdus cladophorae TaxID=3377108 RepID=UPI003B8460D3
MAQSEYRARVGDKLTVEVLEDGTLNRTVEILPDGRISFPFIGGLRASGRTVGQIEASIANGISPNFATKPNVFVTLQPKERVIIPSAPKEPDTINIYFMGEVAAPGIKKMEPGTTLLQALSQSGGLSKFAATKRIQLRRTDKAGRQTITSINYKALSEGAAMRSDPQLRDGDVILVPERRLFE